MDTFQTQGKERPESISVADYQLLAPNLFMRVEDHGRDGRLVRSDGNELAIEALEKACAASDVRVMREFKIDLEGAAGNAAVKRSDEELEISQDMPLMLMTPANEQLQSALLHQDEFGEVRWILPETNVPGGKNKFSLPPVKAGMPHRGPVTKKIRRIVKVIAWLAGDVIGHTATQLVTIWENRNRPYGLLGYNNGQLTGQPNYDRLKTGKSLLFLHGTFSTAPAAFAGLLADSHRMKAIEQAYEGRIFAFNHPSLHASPAGNIQELNARIPDALRGAKVDIVTHSRGGLVGRELMAQTQAGLGPGLQVEKAILVAAPNRGTILTNEEHWISLIDTYTNLLLSLPDNAITIVLEGIISLIKILAGQTVKALPGLQSMRPDGDYLKGLEQRSIGDTNRVYTMGANYLPKGKSVVDIAKAVALKVVLQKIFGENSDMVVPTGGSLDLGPDSALPIPPERQMLFDTDSLVNHINFFNSDLVNQQLVDWLTKP